jgi:asparagine synthase (glutamine-hydrolysing)
MVLDIYGLRVSSNSNFFIIIIRKYANQKIGDQEFSNASLVFPFNTSQTKEGFLYRKIFHSHFSHVDVEKTVNGGPSIACSTPAAVEWEQSWKDNNDPSGTAIHGIHNNYKQI